MSLDTFGLRLHGFLSSDTQDSTQCSGLPNKRAKSETKRPAARSLANDLAPTRDTHTRATSWRSLLYSTNQNHSIHGRLHMPVCLRCLSDLLHTSAVNVVYFRETGCLSRERMNGHHPPDTHRGLKGHLRALPTEIISPAK